MFEDSQEDFYQKSNILKQTFLLIQFKHGDRLYRKGVHKKLFDNDREDFIK